MKKLLFAACATVAMAFSSATETFAKPIHVTISFDLARPKKNCESGVWFCKVKGTVDLNLSMQADAAFDADNGKIVFTFNQPLNEEATRQGYFYAETGEEVVLPPDLARKYGVSSVTIKPGKYSIDMAAGKYGAVTVDTNFQ